LNLADFYRAVLPGDGDYYAIFKMETKQHVWCSSIDQLVKTTELLHESQGVYYATASFEEPTKRTGENVMALRSLRLDIDAGAAKYSSNPEGVYPTQRDALSALVAFAKETGLVPSYIVSSGEGLHAYWALSNEFEPRIWRPVARRLGELCVEHGLKADPAVTTDTARILRPPGSLHPNGSRVTILKATGRVYELTELVSKLGVTPEEEDPFAFAAGRTFDSHVNADVVVQGPPKSVMQIVQKCPAMNYAAQQQGDIPEPYWRAMLGIVKHTVEGLDMAHEMSKGHPGYDPHETEKKYNAYTAGPPTCAEFSKHNNAACQGCEYAGKIKSPITLGVLNDEQVAELPADQQPKPPPPPPQTGMPWDGLLPALFQVVGIPGNYTLQCTMKVTKDDPDGKAVTTNITVPVTKDIFWLGNWSEAADSKDTAAVEVFVYNNGDIRRYLMDQSLAAGSFDLLKWLAGKAIHISTDKKASQAVNDYVKLQLQRIKNLAKRPKITGRFGLQITPKGELICAQGNHVIYPDGTVHEAMLAEGLAGSANHHIVPLPPSPSGEWDKTVWPTHIVPKARKYVEFMTKFYGVPGLEKYQLVAMLGLASPFMAFVTGGYTTGLDLPPNGLSVSLYSRKSEQGKTALVSAIMLAYGNPAKLVGDSNEAGATAIGRMARVSISGTFPTSMDEMGGTKEQSIASMISSVANGSGRTRGTKSGGFTTSQGWALINLITTNRAQRDMVSVGQSESSAIQYRLLELNVDDVVFNRDARDAYRDAWPEIMAETQGALGAVINYAACKIGYAKLNLALVACVKEADLLLQADQGARFQYRGLAALLFLQTLLENQGLAMFDRQTLIDEFKKAHASGVEHIVEHVLPTDGCKLLSIMLHEMKQNTLVTETETHRGVNSKTYDLAINSRIPDKVHARYVTSMGHVYVSTDAARNWANEKKINEREMIDTCKQRGILMPMRPGTQEYTGQLDLFKGMREAGAGRVRCYKINTRTLSAATGGWEPGEEEGADNVVHLHQPKEDHEQLELQTPAAGHDGDRTGSGGVV
jgi:hypothetical protein